MTLSPPTAGWIDIHSHLLPGIDDGCRIIDESIDCVLRLKARGYAGTICTPHVWDYLFPNNTTENIRAWTTQLQRDLRAAGIDYAIWPGGEMRLYEGISDWLKDHEPPALADSRLLLFDFWADAWPAWVEREFEGVLRLGYQPILAHPERINCGRQLDPSLRNLASMGVWLQGNFRSMTGQEGYLAGQMVRQLIDQGRYQFLALDMHGPETLESRLDGLALVEAEFGSEKLQRLIAQAPRELIFPGTPGSSPGTTPGAA